MPKFLSLIFLCFGAYHSYGQFAVSLKGGINISDLVVRNGQSRYSSGYQTGVSFHLGLFTKFKLAENLNFIPELQFIQKKSSVDQASDIKIKLSYIELPFLISYHPWPWFAVEAGPSIGFKVGDNTFTNYFNSIDAGVNGGLRFGFDSRWSFIARYYYGLATVDKTYWNAGPSGSADLLRLYNQNLQFSVAYFLK